MPRAGPDHRNQMSPLHNLTLLQLELNFWFVWPEENWSPWPSLVSPKKKIFILSPMEFWFLAVFASGLLMLGTHHKVIGLILGWFSPSDNPRQCPNYLGWSKDYLIRFSCGVRCVTSDWIRSEARWRRPDRDQIRNPAVWGEPRGRTCIRSPDYHVKRNHNQSESELTNAVMTQHKKIWTLSLQFLPAITKDWDFAITLKSLNTFFE